MVKAPPQRLNTRLEAFMARLLLLIVFLFLIPQIATAKGFSTVQSVAVIGAGPAGLAAAEKLKRAGLAVTVFEKNWIGGKCKTIPCKKGYGAVELGAIQVGIGYPTVNYYRKELGLKLRKYWPSMSLRKHECEQGPSYQTLQQEFWPHRDILAIGKEIKVMSDALARFAPIDESGFTEFPDNSEFLESFQTWAQKLDLYHFMGDYGVWITSYGYGNLIDIPAFLPLSLINSSMGLVAMRMFDMNLRMLDAGYGGLMHGIVQHYNLDVKEGAAIQKISRGDFVTINYQHNGEKKEEQFDKLVVACGFECARDLFGEGLTTEEAHLVNDLQYTPYDVVIADIPDLPKGGYVLPENFSTSGKVTLMSKNSAQGDEVIVYIPRGGISTADHSIKRPTEDALKSIVERDMAHFGLTVAQFHHVEYWDTYFPHFKNHQSYKLLNQIQGFNNTVYVGSMATFEIVERAMRHAHEIVDRHVLNEPPPPKNLFDTLGQSLTSFYDYFTAQNKEF